MNKQERDKAYGAICQQLKWVCAEIIRNRDVDTRLALKKERSDLWAEIERLRNLPKTEAKARAKHKRPSIRIVR